VENTLRWEKAAQAALFHPAVPAARHAHHLIALPAVINHILTRHIQRKNLSCAKLRLKGACNSSGSFSGHAHDNLCFRRHFFYSIYLYVLYPEKTKNL